jgi:hypothetical protein
LSDRYRFYDPAHDHARSIRLRHDHVARPLSAVAGEAAPRSKEQLLAVTLVSELAAELRAVGVPDARRQAMRSVEQFYFVYETLDDPDLWDEWKDGAVNDFRRDPVYARSYLRDAHRLPLGLMPTSSVVMGLPQRAREPRARATARTTRRSRSRSSGRDDPHEPSDIAARAGRRA